MIYKIIKKNGLYKIKRKKFLFWTWLDNAKAWDNSYGKIRPYCFNNLDLALEFISQEENLCRSYINKKDLEIVLDIK